MLNRIQFVIFESESIYSVTECSSSGISQAFLEGKSVKGDTNVLLRLSKFMPPNVSIEDFVKSHAGELLSR